MSSNLFNGIVLTEKLHQKFHQIFGFYVTPVEFISFLKYLKSSLLRINYYESLEDNNFLDIYVVEILDLFETSNKQELKIIYNNINLLINWISFLHSLLRNKFKSK